MVDHSGRPRALRVLRDDSQIAAKAAQLELAAGQVASSTLPEGLERHEVRPSGSNAAWRHAVSWTWVPGTRLDAWLARNGPTGLPPAIALTIARDVYQALSALHAAGFIHRRPTPEHIIIDDDGRATLVGLGHVTPKKKPHPDAAPLDDPYVAPEARQERSGRFHTWQADAFTFGLLLAYLATGERPTGNVTAPLTRDAYLRLHDQPEGLALLVGRCTQPLQKNRIPWRELGTHLDVSSLPDRKTPGFGPLELIAAWGSRDPADLRVGSLSAGPLVNRTASADEPRSNPTAPEAVAGAPAGEAPPATTEPAGNSWLALAVSMAVVVGGAVLAWLRLR